LGISPIPLLMAEAFLSDTGGVATLVGDPPNILIGSAANLSFLDFVVNLAPIVLVAWLVTLILIRLLFREELAQQPSNLEALKAVDENDYPGRGCGFVLPSSVSTYASWICGADRSGRSPILAAAGSRGRDGGH
jgi:Na+/H+ antiporter NhaD/arsenite permease-like protein